MATLLRSDVHVNRPLTSLSVATIQDEIDFICDKVFPVVSVPKQSDRYIVYDRSYWFRTGAAKRAPATESAGGGFSIDNTPTYFCDRWAYHIDIDDDLRTNADDPIDVDRDGLQFVMRNILLRREKLFNARYLAPGIWGGLVATNSAGIIAPEDFAPAVKWSNANSNPMQDISTLMTAIKRSTGVRANTMVVTHDVNEALKQHPMVLSRLTYDNLKVVTEDLLSRLFNVDRYLVASAVENTSQEGQTGQYNFISDNKFLLTYAAPSPGILKPSAGYIFSWAGRYGASALGSRVSTYRMDMLQADRLEAEMAFDMHQVSPELGILGVELV